MSCIEIALSCARPLSCSAQRLIRSHREVTSCESGKLDIAILRRLKVSEFGYISIFGWQMGGKKATQLGLWSTYSQTGSMLF